LKAGHVEVVTGINLPLLIKAATLRQHVNGLPELAQQVVRAGRQYIQAAPNITTAEHASEHNTAVKHADV